MSYLARSKKQRALRSETLVFRLDQCAAWRMARSSLCFAMCSFFSAQRRSRPFDSGSSHVSRRPYLFSRTYC